MNFEEYQKKSKETAIYPDVGNNIAYPTLGLSGEAGEISNKVKKIFRDDGGVISDVHREDLTKELGDVLWYVAQLASELNLDLEEIAEKNIERLFSRKERGVLAGSGDNR